MPVLGRLVAIVALLGVLGAGWYVSARGQRGSAQRVAQMHTSLAVLEDVEVGSMARQAAYDVERFAEDIDHDAAGFGIDSIAPADLAKPQTHHVEIDAPMILRPDGQWASPRVSVAVSVEKVNYRQHGATVSATHRIVTLANVSPGPLAYKLSVGAPGSEKCQVRGSRTHNAMALRPNETAEVVVCAGRGRVRIDHLQTLTITDLGYHYLSQLPATAVGYDTVVAYAHRKATRVRPCDETDPTDILRMQGTGPLHWVDVADFYSRHSCHRFDLFEAYRYRAEALPRLPALPPDLRGF